MKRFLNAALVAIFAGGLSFVNASCSDDKESSEEEKQQKEEQQAETDLDQAAEFWNVVGQLTDDLMPDDWQHATYAPSIGEPDGENATVRIVSTANAETAAARFAQLTGANINESTQDYTYQSDVVGTLKYHRTGGTSLATVDVDIKQMPDLTQIIYQSPEQMGSNSKFNGTAYYRFGDVIEKKNSDNKTDYWICVRPAFGPAGKGDSHWITVSNIPSANVKEVTKIINKQKVVHQLPKSLSTNREHMQNLAEMLYAMTNPKQWANNLATNDGYRTLKYFRDFNYKELFKYNDDNFFNNVAENWEQKGLFKEIFGMNREQLKAVLESTGLNLVYSSATMSGNKIVLPMATYYNTNLKTEVLSKSNTEWTTQFDIQEMLRRNRYIEYSDIAGHQLKGWLVRYATGATLCKGSDDKVVSDKYKKLTNCKDVFVYNRDVLKMSMKDNDLKNTPPGIFGKGGDLGYYTTGDIVRYNNRYYVCASNHVKNGTARFVTFNDQDSHTTMSFEWKQEFMTTKDVVYNDEMASAETLAEWCNNIFLNDEMYTAICTGMKNKNLSQYTYELVPETEDERLELAKFMTNEDYIITNLNEEPIDGIGALDFHIQKFFWDYLQEYSDEKGIFYDIMKVAPVFYLLADKMRYSDHLFERTEHWVPYIIFIKDKTLYEKLKPYLEKHDDLQRQSCSHFTWQDMGLVERKGDKLARVIDKPYHIVKLAHYWIFQLIDNSDVYGVTRDTAHVIDYTLDLKENPSIKQSEISESIWGRRCVTSRELTFTDTGEKNSDLENVWVAKER